MTPASPPGAESRGGSADLNVLGQDLLSMKSLQRVGDLLWRVYIHNPKA
jgi:hypothetical protein